MGVVNTLYRIDEPDGPWLSAACRVTAPPGWLTRGTQASFAFLPVQESSFTQPGDADHIRLGWITEVIDPEPRNETGGTPSEGDAAPARQAAEAEARSRDPRHSHTPRPRRVPRPNHRDARRRAEEDELNRRLDWLEQHTGRPADVEAVVIGMQRELHGQSLDDLIRQHRLAGVR